MPSKSKKTQQNADGKEVNQNESYVIEKILKRKIVKSKKMFLIKWRGYATRYNTWEPIENIQEFNPDFVDTFDAKGIKKERNQGNIPSAESEMAADPARPNPVPPIPKAQPTTSTSTASIPNVSASSTFPLSPPASPAQASPAAALPAQASPAQALPILALPTPALPAQASPAQASSAPALPAPALLTPAFAPEAPQSITSFLNGSAEFDQYVSESLELAQLGVETITKFTKSSSFQKADNFSKLAANRDHFQNILRNIVRKLEDVQASIATGFNNWNQRNNAMDEDDEAGDDEIDVVPPIEKDSHEQTAAEAARLVKQ